MSAASITLEALEHDGHRLAEASVRAAVRAGADEDTMRRTWWPGGAANPTTGLLAWQALTAVATTLFQLAAGAERERGAVPDPAAVPSEAFPSALARELEAMAAEGWS